LPAEARDKIFNVNSSPTTLFEKKLPGGQHLEFVYYENFLTKEIGHSTFAELLRQKFVQDATSGRLVLAFSDDPDISYFYNGESHRGSPLTPTLRAIRDRVAAICGHKINHILVNLYPHGGIGVGWHRDKEPSITESSTIATLSLGARRVFDIKMIGNPLVYSFAVAPLPVPDEGTLPIFGQTLRARRSLSERTSD